MRAKSRKIVRSLIDEITDENAELRELVAYMWSTMMNHCDDTEECENAMKHIYRCIRQLDND